MNRRRDVHGILPLDKPVGFTSNDALQVVKAIYRARKAGHTGSLDMVATGMLPVCFGEATKMSGFLLAADKLYRVACRLGKTTTTGDSDGELVAERPVPRLRSADVERTLANFRGEIEQIPPMYSALKHQGKRLYQLARQGLEVERPPRRVVIRELRLLSLEEQGMELQVRCSKGTYIRTLVEDIGKRLGCGGHVCALRRLEAGPFREEQMVSLQRLRELEGKGAQALDPLPLKLDRAVAAYPAVSLDQSSLIWYLRPGQAVLVPNSPTEGLVRLYDCRDRFLGMGRILDDGRIAPHRLLFSGRGEKRAAGR